LISKLFLQPRRQSLLLIVPLDFTGTSGAKKPHLRCIDLLFLCGTASNRKHPTQSVAGNSHRQQVAVAVKYVF
jgi:hypothetical protein